MVKTPYIQCLSRTVSWQVHVCAHPAYKKTQASLFHFYQFFDQSSSPSYYNTSSVVIQFVAQFNQVIVSFIRLSEEHYTMGASAAISELESVHKIEYLASDLNTPSVTLFPSRAQVYREIKGVQLKVSYPASSSNLSLAPTN